MHYGWLHVISLFFLSLIVTLVLSINDGDTLAEVTRMTVRRWGKLLTGLFLIALIVQLMSL